MVSDRQILDIPRDGRKDPARIFIISRSRVSIPKLINPSRVW